MSTARQKDLNGYITIDKNPITRVGVFAYSGRGLPGADPDKIYNVLRPEEELSNPETLKSFELLPLIDEHVMLGEGYATPAEEKGVHGYTGENITYDRGMVYASMRIISDTLKTLIDQGKKQLSCGYRCVFEKSSGVFNGQAYDYIQRQIRGNHIALVQQGRMGKDVAVLDGIVFDHFDLATGEDTMSKELEQALTALNTTVAGLAKTVAAMDEDMKTMKAKDEEEEKKKKAEDEAEEEKKKKEAEDKAAKDKEGDDDEEGMDKAAMDSAIAEAIKPYAARVAQLESGQVGNLISTLTSRDHLAKEISAFTGAFDHAHMTEEAVLGYAIDKLQITAPKGHERVAVDAFIAGRKAAAGAAPQTFALDTKPKSGGLLEKSLNS